MPAFLLALVFLLTTLPAAYAREMVSIGRAEVNLRTGPGTRYRADWILGRGYPLLVTQRKGNWLHVRDFENVQGWILRSLSSRTPHHVVTTAVANLRSAPSTRAKIVGKAQYGDVLRTLDKRKGWVKVRDESGLRGWIAKRLLWGW